jgi:hypothetical protein
VVWKKASDILIFCPFENVHPCLSLRLGKDNRGGPPDPRLYLSAVSKADRQKDDKNHSKERDNPALSYTMEKHDSERPSRWGILGCFQFPSM